MLDKLRAAVRPYAPLPIRFGVGLALLVQGWAHATGPAALTRSLERADLPLAEPITWVVVGLELIGGAALLLGFQTRIAAGVLLAWLCVDCFVVHLPQGWWADEGGFQVPLLLLLGTLSLWLGGPGRASVDSIRGRV
jgi:putative oxidoreductase